MKSKPHLRHCPHHLSPIALAISIVFMPTAWAGVEIDQTPLTVGKPLEPNIWFILDDSASMARDFMPETAPSGNTNRKFHLRNTIFYNPAVTYTPWVKADGTSMPNATYTNVSNDDDELIGSLNLASSAQCFNTLRTPTSNPNDNNQLYRWRLNTNGTADRCNTNDNCTNNTGCTSVSSFTWTTDNGPITRTIAQERQNYANWYHYYRTRMKMAKGSVSRAFATLGENFRVGYTSIWDSGTFNISVSSNDGLFVGTNKNTWYTRLFNAKATGSSTPLRQALNRAGQYFSRSDADGPYGPESGSNQLSCRQNFTILTTDGYWNDSSAGSPSPANADNTDGAEITSADGSTTYKYTPAPPYKDTTSNTLADVAMYYWKRDLRPDLDNNVPTTGTNPAFWQHMRVFGISIGMQGTLNPQTALPGIAAGTTQWPVPGSNKIENIDDLWHATVNARGEFLVASDPEEFTAALTEALGAIKSEIGRSASGAASSTTVSAGSMSYFTEYVSGTWSGDVHGYALDPATGRRATTPDGDWAASEKLPTWNTRKIYFNKGGTLTAFTWGNLGTYQTTLGSEQIVNYLRGERSNEKTTTNPSGTLRPRDGALGSFVNSQPVYVGEPPYQRYYGTASTPGADTYAAHAEAQKNRKPMLYVGGNDGMLHGFDAKTGKEEFAFMPAAVLSQNGAALKQYATDQEYEHQYFVDGELTVAEAYLNGSWRTILAGSLGRGGKSVFALDVTNPDNITLLWEKTSDDHSAIGNTLGKPIIAEVGPLSATQGDWRVVLGNGPNSNGDRAQLITISLPGGVVKAYDTGAGSNNGLAAPLVWDSDSDGHFDTVYAGDINGNLWRFAGLDKTTPASPFKLFTTHMNRPITAAPWAAVNQKYGNTWVFVGTGRYLNEDDRADTSVQSWYGLIDDRTADDAGTPIGPRATDLVERRITQTGTISGRSARTLEAGTEGEIINASKRGWFIDFTQEGERMITPNSFFGSALLGTTFVPDGSNLCEPGGRSELWGINPFTGGRLSRALFDFNRDGVFDESLGGAFPSVMGGLKPILVGVPPITIMEDGHSNKVIMHTDPNDSEEFRPPSGDAEARSWREVLGE